MFICCGHQYMNNLNCARVFEKKNMEVYRTIVYLYAFIVLTNSAEVGNPTWTVCAGNQTSFFCETIDPLNVLLVIFVKENQTIGLYTPGGVTAVYPEFKDRYRIIEEQSGISLKIIKTKTLDQGRFFCQITYDVKPNVKLEKFLIVKGTLNGF
ncbi:hypothetical protein KUTeg_006215 [Tegillarca granosa]|uniref:Immunoglobulin subtype domain-containing protein n=1 Tax=Tegillarca granosa TaxID=220873 RepID=A0ABQ9FHR1_TEGGR|nr:hypothetical protein KUTeg_006215 [Tegillarca granosa]